MKETHIVHQILDYLAAKHIFAFQIGTGMFFGQYKGKSWAFKAHSLGPGAADILCQRTDLVLLWIECKVPGRAQGRAQRQFEDWVTSLGHRYVIARSIDDLAGIV
jgi:hypothetical protein